MVDIPELNSRKWHVAITHAVYEVNECADLLAKPGASTVDELTLQLFESNHRLYNLSLFKKLLLVVFKKLKHHIFIKKFAHLSNTKHCKFKTNISIIAHVKIAKIE